MRAICTSEKFAAMFKSLPNGPYTCPDVLDVCLKTARIFERDNTRFDRKRYLLACGVREIDIHAAQTTGAYLSNR